MANAQKQGAHKPYGPKMKNPRIAASKEHRGCGPLGYYRRWQEEQERRHRLFLRWGNYTKRNVRCVL